MEQVRKYLHRDPKTGREICYVAGLPMCDGKVKICEILADTENAGKEVICVYVENHRKESCLWKKIIVTWANIIELEFDWTKIIGYD